MMVPPNVSTESNGRTETVSRDARHRIALIGSDPEPPPEGSSSLVILIPLLSVPPVKDPNLFLLSGLCSASAFVVSAGEKLLVHAESPRHEQLIKLRVSPDEILEFSYAYYSYFVPF